MDGGFVDLDGLRLYRIAGAERMAPFLMSLVGAGDQWMFVASNGGLTAGRVSPETALFPYETEDRLYDQRAQVGPLSVLHVARGGRPQRWEPWGDPEHTMFQIERNLYKDHLSTTLVFEEINHDLGLAMRYTWQTGPRFGFVRSCRLANIGAGACAIRILDGLQNILPHGATTALQSGYSNLLDAYKRAELDPSGLAIFALSSTLTDLAEASESLRATVAWQIGLEGAVTLLSSGQVAAFRRGAAVGEERDVRGRRGAFLLAAELDLAPGAEHAWRIVADVAQDAADVARLARMLSDDRAGLAAALAADIADGRADLEALVAAADGLQLSADELTGAHHASNTLFNIMRGGVFADGTTIESADLKAFIAARSPALLSEHAAFFDGLPQRIGVRELRGRAEAVFGAIDQKPTTKDQRRSAGTDHGPGTNDQQQGAARPAPFVVGQTLDAHHESSSRASLARLCAEYLPLSFSRRHGDPSRPWNRFQINLRGADGSRKRDYQGNWRDLFQNWEPLGYAFPDYLEGMIAVFLNATTADGYNPYRIARGGIEWEAPEPSNPWANIGYWSDHQIIYLLKLLEAQERHAPGRLRTLLGRRAFSHANVPYRIKPYAELLEDPADSIVFDHELEHRIAERVAAQGADGKLLQDADGRVIHVSLAEKLLVLLLAKLVNFVPDGGIWMNTQRPEWNDANNALVGKGLSVVTLAYLRRYLAFCRGLFAEGPGELAVSAEVHGLFAGVVGALGGSHPLSPSASPPPSPTRGEGGDLSIWSGRSPSPLVGDGLGRGGAGDAHARRALMDALGAAGERYREAVYRGGLSGELRPLARGELLGALDLMIRWVEASLRANRREDGLYHSYNTLRLSPGRAEIGRLAEMLEGQVAILSAGLLGAEESLALLGALRRSALYRDDQGSYLLYPDRELPGFRAKNRLTAEQVRGLGLPAALAAAGDRRLLLRDVDGDYHFCGDFRNARDLRAALAELGRDPRFAEPARAEGAQIEALFEATFRHGEFTGRSGSFFAYEGLGSIYWHMVAKLLLAVQETYERAAAAGAGADTVAGLAEAYHAVRAGLGFRKTPSAYGAFPTDPYSHTPKGRGAQQPGMTGQVKEELLTRLGELGVTIHEGRIAFRPRLLDPAEWGATPQTFHCIDVAGRRRSLGLPANALAFTLCQTPVVYVRGDSPQITVRYADGRQRTLLGDQLDAEASGRIFGREGKIESVTVVVRFDG